MKKLFSAAAIASVCVFAAGTGQASAGITFDEYAATNNNVPLTNAYAKLGVTFGGNNDGTWGGLSNGDPGGWKLEGTDGPNFLLFKVGSIENNLLETVTLGGGGAPYWSFETSLAYTDGSVMNGTITLFAYHDSTQVGHVSALLEKVNTWSGLAFWYHDGITRIDIYATKGPAGTGDNFAFGVDNLVFGNTPEPSTWAMMILGFAGIGFVGYRKRKGAALPAA